MAASESVAPLNAPPLCAFGTFLIGFGAGLFGHGTLTATMNQARLCLPHAGPRGSRLRD
jgi:hypothetical protein